MQSGRSLPHLKGKPLVKTFPANDNGLDRDDKPVLVFIHGTFSNSASSFAKLWTEYSDQINELSTHYDNKVYALEHRTLGVSPIDNAITLVKACKADTRSTFDHTFQRQSCYGGSGPSRRLVQVACPARGTLLASKRLDA
ncbi:MAG: hypothetical protein ACI9XK_001738 [Granulosicoccus sp.]|jgi:hypothetical protein